MPQVSVIIPTYNRSRCVREAIESVLAQSYRDFELIVVDDGSTDDTPSVLAAFGDRIRAIRQTNAGVSAARNAGIHAASGAWLAFLDSDDLWTPQKLEKQVASVSAHPNVVGQMVDALVIGYSDDATSMFEVRGCREDFAGRPLRERPLIDVLNVQFFTSTWMLRRDAVEACGRFKVGFTIYEDFELLSKVALRGPFAVDTFGGVKMRRVAHQQKALSDQHVEAKIRSVGNVCEIYEGLLRQPDLTAVEAAEVGRRLSGSRYELAEAHGAAGNAAQARRLRWQSVKDSPGPRSFIRTVLGPTAWKKLSALLKPGKREFRRSEMDAKGAKPAVK